MDKKDRDSIAKLIKSLDSIKAKYDKLSAKYSDTNLIAAAKAVCSDAKETANELVLCTSKQFDLIAPRMLDLTDWNQLNGKRVYFFTVNCYPYCISVCYDFAESSKVAKTRKQLTGFTAADVNIIGLHFREQLEDGSTAYSDTRALLDPIDVSGERTFEEWGKVKTAIAERKSMDSLAVRAFKSMLESKHEELRSKLFEKMAKSERRVKRWHVEERCSDASKHLHK